MTSARGAALRGVPLLFCLALFWPGLIAWFQQDDFAWLNLADGIHSWDDFCKAIFSPRAQGTIRPLSERLYFIFLYWTFGLDPLPFRIAAFLTHFVNLLLLGEIARRLSRWEAAVVVAPVLWTANAALAFPLSWTSAYNQILCGSFLLGAFLLFLQYVETGQRKYYWGQVALFLFGFGALEINVVYPALAGGYALLCARRHFKSTLPLFAVSLAYVLLHSYAAPKPKSGTYALHFDQALPLTFLHYWTQAFGGTRLPSLTENPLGDALGAVIPWIGTLALVGYAAWRLRQRDLLPLFLLGWFAVVIAPVLPLRDHLTGYYLTLPVIGLALLGAVALHAAWGRGWLARSGALAVAAIYLATSGWVTHREVRYLYERSERVRHLVMGVQRVAALHPGKIILLSGLRSDLFWAAVVDRPFSLLGLRSVFLTPGSENMIQKHPELGEISDFVLPQAATRRALLERKAVVYDASAENRLRNITTLYTAVAALRWRDTFSRKVEIGHPYFSEHLGRGWYQVEGGYRWMAKRAEVVLSGPATRLERLDIKGFAPERVLAAGPLHLSVTVDGSPVGSAAITEADQHFELSFPLPASAVGRDRIRVVLEVDRTYTVPGEGRPLGLIFGTVAIR